LIQVILFLDPTFLLRERGQKYFSPSRVAVFGNTYCVVEKFSNLSPNALGDFRDLPQIPVSDKFSLTLSPPSAFSVEVAFDKKSSQARVVV
jgi:hypothetical protein